MLADETAPEIFLESIQEKTRNQLNCQKFPRKDFNIPPGSVDD
jgi:hypothetical protein